MSKQIVQVEGMHCNGCANSVKTKFETVSGVSEVEMHLEDNQAVVEADHSLTTDELNHSLEDTTYQVVDVKA